MTHLNKLILVILFLLLNAQTSLAYDSTRAVQQHLEANPSSAEELRTPIYKIYGGIQSDVNDGSEILNELQRAIEVIYMNQIMFVESKNLFSLEQFKAKLRAIKLTFLPENVDI